MLFISIAPKPEPWHLKAARHFAQGQAEPELVRHPLTGEHVATTVRLPGVLENKIEFSDAFKPAAPSFGAAFFGTRDGRLPPTGHNRPVFQLYADGTRQWFDKELIEKNKRATAEAIVERLKETMRAHGPKT